MHRIACIILSVSAVLGSPAHAMPNAFWTFGFSFPGSGNGLIHHAMVPTSAMPAGGPVTPTWQKEPLADSGRYEPRVASQALQPVSTLESVAGGDPVGRHDEPSVPTVDADGAFSLTRTRLEMLQVVL